MAAADGMLADEEVRVIRYVGLKYFELDFDEDLIREMFQQMGSEIDPEAEIQGNLGAVSLQDDTAIEALIQGMTVVAACDGAISDQERQLIKRIGKALGANNDTIARMIERAEGQSNEWRASLPVVNFRRALPAGCIEAAPHR